MTSLWPDLRFSLRAIRRSPLFASVAILSLALGIGANTAIFSLIDTMLLKMLPVKDPQQLVSLTDPTSGGTSIGTSTGERNILSTREFEALRDRTQSFSGMLAAQSELDHNNASIDGKAPEELRTRLVSGGYFPVLGATTFIGRPFTAADERGPGSAPYTVISYEFWQRRFGGSPAVLDSHLHVGKANLTVIGVAQPHFLGENVGEAPDLWIPLDMQPQIMPGRMWLEDDSAHIAEKVMWLHVIGRLKPGVSRKQAQANVDVVFKQVVAEEFSKLSQSQPDILKQNLVLHDAGAGVSSLRGNMADPLYVLMAVVALVLIIACANVANLLLARSQARSREIAIRLAIGAGRVRLLRQLLIESLVLAMSGCVLGLGFAFAGIRFLQTLKVPTDIPVVIAPQLDQRVLLYSLIAAVLSALVFGIAPAWQALKTDLVPALRSAGLTASARRRTIGRNALVVSQVALSLVLLVATGMLLDGFRKVLVMNPGFRIDHIMTMDFDTSLVPASEATHEFYRNLIDRARALPGVKSATLSLVVPLAPNQSNQTVIPEGFQFPKGQESAQVLQNAIDERYFDVMQTPILRGRAFTTNDKADSTRVAIVNEEFAKKYWPNQDAVGKKIRLEDAKGPLFQIVGVAKTAKYIFVAEPPQPFVYFPFTQHPQTSMSILVETYGDPAAMTAPIRDVVRSLNPDQPIYNARTLANFYDQRAVAVFLMILQLVAAMGTLGLALAVVGLYGLIAYSVSRRTQEIGIRMALGAQRSDVAALILRQGFVLAIIGIAIGFAASIAVRGILAQGLIGLGTLSPAVLAIVPVGLLLVTMAACYLPARRASQIDPLRALRWE